MKRFCYFLFMLTCLVAGGWPVTSWATDCPITHYSANYASAKWCYLSLRDANYHLKYEAANDYITVDHSQTTRPADNADAYLWAFVGTPEGGFKIYNKLAGSTKILTSVKPTGGGTTTYPSMQTEAGLDTETYNTTWDAAIYELGVKIARHGETTYLSEGGGFSKLNFWTGLDQGSRFMISPADETLSDLGTPSLSPAGKTYMLINRYTGKALGNGNVTISAVETNVGTSTSVIGTTYNNTDVQWGLTADGAKWQFVNKANSHYLNTTPNSGYLPINSTASSYYLRETGDGYYYLLTYTSVGAGDGEKIALADDGTNSHLWAASGLQAEWELREVAAASSITSGRYYRLHNVAYPNLTMSEYLSSGGVWGEDNNDNTYSQIWQITSTGANTYSLKNVMSGKYIQKTPGQSTQFHTGVASSNLYSHTSTINGFTAFAFDNNDNGNTSLHCAESRSYNVVGWTYSDTNASYWYLEEVTLTGADLTAISNLRTNNVLIDGNYYRITNKAYPGRSMSETDGHVNTVLSEDAYTQMWYVTFSSSNCDLQNAWTQNHIQGFAGRSVVFPTGASTHYYTPSYHESGGKIYYTFGDSGSGDGSRFLHNASTQGYNVVGWGNDAEASMWMVEKLDVDPSDISVLRTSVTTDYTSALSTFFDDNACTTLNSTYAAMEDAALRTAMSALPTALQDMAVRVKNNVWTDKGNPIATLGYNVYEKDFRIHDYEIYSNPNLWQAITQVGPFARLTNPTGITAVAGDILYIFVEDDVKDSDASLQAELVTGTDRSGATTTLTHGYNAIYVDRDCELFITYLLNNTSKSCNDYPDIKIHIEGGTCNGFFDLTHKRHNNDDWAWMKLNMFADEYLHVKSNSTLLNCYRERVVDPVNVQDVKTIMDIFDFCFDNLENLAGCNQWKSTGQYKTMANNYDITSGNPHWAGDHGYAQPGIYYDGIFNANNLKNVGTGGGNIWVIMHELGHGHQSPINLSSQTESSNNSLAQCVNFLTTNSTRGQSLFTTTRSSRGDGVKGLVSRFNDGYSWIDLGGMRTQSGDYNDVWIGNKLIFQLWLYFDYMGNYPQTPGNEGFSFITALYDALRADPLVKGGTKASPRPATDDYLKLAKKAADITETDLSEFFEAWGFWKLAATKSTLNDGTPADDDPENSIWYFGDYSNNYIQTSQAQVDEIKDGMTSYSTKASNIMFLEDRGVGSTLPTHDDAATSTYGDVGYYESYGNAVSVPYSASVVGTTVTISGGTGAVGYKIYDDSGNLVAISNTNSFTVTSEVAEAIGDGTYTVKAAQGDGQDYIVASTGHEATYNATTVTWTSGVAMLESTTTGNHTGGWFSVVAPFHGTISTFTMNMGTGSPRADAYLAISRDLKTTTTGFTASDFVAISTNTCGTTEYEVDMTFSPAVELQGGVTYYFYFVTESAGVYTTVNERYYVEEVNRKYTMSIGNVGSTTPINIPNAYAIPFTCTMNLTGDSYYRMKGIWPTEKYDCYLYSNATNENKIWKTHTETPAVTDARYVWQATLDGTGVVLQNVGNSHYISPISGSTNGSSANYLSATTLGSAENFSLGDRANFSNSTNCYAGYVTLQSQTNSGIYLNTYTNQNEWVGSHNASPNNGDPILFQQVKKVTFSTAVPVNDGDAVSTIYVAIDGSDDFTLPSGYAYKIGTTWYSHTGAVTAIEASNEDDIAVTVEAVETVLENDKKYRLLQTWTGTGYYLYANTSDGSNGDRLWKTSSPAGNKITNGNYIWQAKADDGCWKLYNPTADRYIAKATSSSTNGNAVNGLSATATADAEPFLTIPAVSGGNQPSDFESYTYVGLKATTQTSIYLDSYSSGNNFVGWHNAPDYGYYFRFIPVKTVTFSSAVTVNNGSAVSTIYVATDGSDTFTLPSTSTYTIGGTTYYATEAVAAIVAAGTSDISVTVNANTPVTDLASSTTTTAYNITCARAWWAVGNDAIWATSTRSGWTGGLSLATSPSDNKQQFAILPFDSDNDGVNDNYCLYSIKAQKFLVQATDGDTKLYLSTNPVPGRMSLTLQSSTYGNASYPSVVTLCGNSFGVHNMNPNIYKYSPHLNDEGNAASILAAGTFDPTTAQTRLAKLPIIKTVTIVDGGNTNEPYDYYGTLTDNDSATPDVFTTSVNAGLPDITLTAPEIGKASAWSQKVLNLKPNATQNDETVTISVPAELGYKISSIALTVRAHSSTYPYTVTVNGNTQSSITGTSSYTFFYDNVNDYTATFTIRCNHAETVGNWLAVTNMTLYMEPIAPSLDAVASSSTSKAYAIANHNGWWAADANATKVTSTASATGGLNLSPSLSDTKQQFAIIPFNGEYYLYHVGEQKFVYWQKDRYTSSSSPSTWLSLSTAPVKSPLTFTTSTSTKYASTEPNIITLNNQYFGVDTSHNPHIYNNQDAANDGNAARILEAGVFDPATAESRLPIATGSLSNIKAYAITCPRGVLTFANGKLCSTACTATDYTEGTFAIITYDKNGDSTNEYYLWSIDGGGFVNASGEIDNTSPTAIQFTDRGGNAYGINFGSSSTNICVTGWGASASDPEGLNITGYSADDGCLFYICPVDDFDPAAAIGYLQGPVTVTYNVVATGGGSTVVTGDGTTYRGTALELPKTLQRAHCNYTFYTDHACTSEITSLPGNFVGSSTTLYAKYASDDIVFSTPGSPVWYNLKSSQDYHVVYDGTANLTATAQRKLEEKYQWIFVGDPYSFKLYNKAAANYLTNAEAGNALSNGTATAATFTAGGTAFTMYTNRAGSEGNIAITEATTYFSILNSPASGTVNFYYHNGITKEDGEITSMDAAYFYPLKTVTVTDLANLTNDKSYVIVNERAVWKFDDNATSMSALGNGNANYYNTEAAAQQIAIIQRDADSDGTPEYYLFSVNAGKYLKANNTLTSAPTNDEQVSITATGNSTYPWFFSFTNVADKNINVNGAPSVLIDSWSSVDAGNSNAIIEAAVFDATDALAMFTEKTVSYTLKYGGTTINTESSVTVRLSAPTKDFMPSSLDNGFMTYTFDPETITSSTTNVDVTATWNGPFQISDSYAGAKWYTIAQHKNNRASNYTWTYNGTDNVKPESVATNNYSGVTNGRLFCFVGDPYNGFDIYNKTAGDSKTMYTANQSTQITMADTGNKFLPKVSTVGTVADGYFCLQPSGQSYYVNYDIPNQKLAGWTSADAGSTCWVENPGDYYLNYIDGLALDAPLGAIGTKEYFTTEEKKNTIRSLRSTIAANLNSGELSSLNGYLDPIEESSTISLGAGYWRIVSAYPGYVTQQSKMPAIYYDHTSTSLKWNINALIDATYSVNTILKLTAVEDNFTIQTPNTRKYLNAANGTLNEGSGAAFTFTSLGSAQYNISTSGNKLHTNGHSSGSGTGGTLVAWNGGLNTCSAWYIVRADEVTLTFNKATDLNGRTNVYATAKMPFNITLPDNDDTEAMAYTMLAENQGTNAGGVLYIKPDELGRRVPANTPVMLVGTSTGAASQTVKATISDDEDMSDVDVPLNNIFKGTYVPLTSNYGSDATKYLTLGRNKVGEDKVVGFYLLSNGSSIAANRAYIPYTTLVGGGDVKGFAIAWDFDEDSIGELTEDVKGQMSDVAYDLQGRRVMKPKKGIYIVNGKKTLVK